METKIADLEVIAGTLRAAIDAGCDDLIACADAGCCPIPFAALATGDADAETRWNPCRRLPRSSIMPSRSINLA